jgi:Domain of unknown function (DUF1877)
MACRGWYTALLPQEASTLLECGDVDRRVEFIDSLYVSAEADKRLQSVDKSWDAMHRCLCDGWLDHEHGEEARRACVIGGRQLSDRADWIISYVEPVLVKCVADAIGDITRSWFQLQYSEFGRNPPGPRANRYFVELVDPEADFEYTWEYFEQVREFYKRAAKRRLATVFIVDQ